MPMLLCPVCDSPLEIRPHAAVCPKGHSYDRAKSGYVNLLMSQRAGEKRHGDDRRMVRARQVFLDAGFYRPLLDALCDIALRYAPENAVTLLDVGCGDGWYTAAVCERLRAAGCAVDAAGLDISRDALIAAATRDKTLTLAVASSARLPVESASCDLVLSLFAPLDAAEAARVLRPKGVLVRAVPTERHLFGLKAALYEHPYENPPERWALPGFTLAEKREIAGEITVEGAALIEALFEMTPYFYKTSREDQAKLAGLERLTTETAFGLGVYRPDA